MLLADNMVEALPSSVLQVTSFWRRGLGDAGLSSVPLSSAQGEAMRYDFSGGQEKEEGGLG